MTCPLVHHTTLSITPQGVGRQASDSWGSVLILAGWLAGSRRGREVSLALCGGSSRARVHHFRQEALAAQLDPDVVTLEAPNDLLRLGEGAWGETHARELDERKA